MYIVLCGRASIIALGKYTCTDKTDQLTDSTSKQLGRRYIVWAVSFLKHT